jgi:hypothetical protein
VSSSSSGHATPNVRRLTHGLTAAGQPTQAAVLRVASLPALVGEVDALQACAVWIVNALADEGTLTRGENMAIVYADIAGRCVQAAATIEAQRFTHRYRDVAYAAPAAGSARVEQQAVIVAFITGKVRGAHEWLQVNGIRDGRGRLRLVLKYYGSYLERARRNALVLAALLPTDGADSGVPSVAQILEALNGHPG